jgi:hypothetical protein
MKNRIGWALAIAIVLLIGYAFGAHADEPRARPPKILRLDSYVGTHLGICPVVDDVMVCEYTAAPLASGRCSSDTECARLFESTKICKDHGGQNKSKTKREVAANGDESCWGECNDGTKVFGLCNSPTLEIPRSLLPVQKRGRQPRRDATR